MNINVSKDFATKAFYAAVGAPIVVGRRVLEYRKSLSEYGGKLTDRAQTRFDDAAAEGEKVADRLKDRKMIEELQNRVDLEKVQERVEQFRDRLESALQNWQESLAPEQTAEEKAPAKSTAKKAPTKKAPAKSTTKKPATKSTTKKPAAKQSTKTPAKTGAK